MWSSTLRHRRLLSLSLSTCSKFYSTTFSPSVILPISNRSPSRISPSSTSLSILPIRFYADHVMVKVPPMADSISEGTLKSWHKKIGEFVKADEEVATIETDKIDVAVNSPASGVIVQQFASEEDTVVVAADLFKLELRDGVPSTEASSTSTTNSIPSSTATTSTSTGTPAVSTPVTSATNHSTTSNTIPTPSKPISSTTTTSTTTTKPQLDQNLSPSVTSTTPTMTLPVSTASSSRIEEREKMSRMRLRISDRLKQSQNITASLTTFNEIDMSNVIQLRNQYKDSILKQYGIKFGFMSIFTKAVSYAMKQVPIVNARIDNNTNEIIYPNFMDISVAVATPKGLVTPVIRNVQSMSLLDIEKSLMELATKARDNKLALEDMAGGTFTISNGGVFGSLFGTPIINLPQSAILGMHAVKERPVVINGKIEIRPIMYICLTYDHRLIDGREAVTFLVKIKEAIEDPRCLLF